MTDLSLEVATRKLRGLSSSSPVSAMNAAEAQFRAASAAYVASWNSDPTNPRMEMPTR